MHHRQSGAAHVNVFFFLVMLVLFLGAIGFAYVTVETNEKLKVDIAAANDRANTAEKDIIGYKHYGEDLGKAIGLTGDYQGRKGLESSYGDLPKNVTLKETYKAEVDAFAAQIKVPAGTNLKAFFGHINSAIESRDSQINTLESERTQLKSQIAALQSELSQEKATRQREIADLNTQITTQRDDFESTQSTMQGQIDNAIAGETAARDKLTEETEAHLAVVASLTKEKNTLTQKNAAIASTIKMVNPPQQPDGKVLSASQAAKRAWIDLGRRDMLPLGTKFTISAPNSSVIKAAGEVIKVQNDRAELQITMLKDRYDPIVKGDLIRNDLYSKGMSRTIYLMGRFSHPYNRKMITNRLRELGNKVVDRLGPSVDLVLVGDDVINEEGSGFTPITETEEWKQVQFLTIESVNLHKVRQYLRLAN